MRDDHYWRSSFLWLALAACLPLLNVSVTWGQSPADDAKAKNVKAKEVEVKPEAVVVEEKIEEAGPVEKASEEKNEELRLQAAPSKYWLGVQIGDVSDELREKLELGKQEGVLVVNVVPDAPAAKAGLKANDVILTYDGEKMAGPRSLVKQVASSKGEEVVLEVMRDGKRLEVKVTPQERFKFLLDQKLGQQLGEGLRQFRFTGPKGESEGSAEQQKLLQEALEQFDIPGLRLHMLPGWVEGGGFEFPANTKISVARENDEPAIITVERGDKKWEVTEDKISELPKDVQPAVRRLLGLKPGRMKIHLGKGALKGPEGELKFNELQVFPPGFNHDRLQRLNDAASLRHETFGKKILDQVREEMKRLRQDVDRLLEHAKPSNDDHQKASENAGGKDGKEL